MDIYECERFLCYLGSFKCSLITIHHFAWIWIWQGVFTWGKTKSYRLTPAIIIRNHFYWSFFPTFPYCIFSFNLANSDLYPTCIQHAYTNWFTYMSIEKVVRILSGKFRTIVYWELERRWKSFLQKFTWRVIWIWENSELFDICG